MLTLFIIIFKFAHTWADNIGMNNYKVTLTYSEAPNSCTSKTRLVLADTKENAIRQAVSLMTFKGKINVLRVDILG